MVVVNKKGGPFLFNHLHVRSVVLVPPRQRVWQDPKKVSVWFEQRTDQNLPKAPNIREDQTQQRSGQEEAAPAEDPLGTKTTGETRHIPQREG